jgi:restriction endonuclease
MNSLEAEYAQYLKEQQLVGNVLWYIFEGIKLKLAPNTTYTPDFCMMRKDGEIAFVETKGFMRDDANVKIKVAASMYPFPFFLAKKKAKKNGGGWDVKEIA